MGKPLVTRVKYELDCRVIVESLERHEEPISGAERPKGAMYLTTEKAARELQDAKLARIVGAF